MDSIAGCVVAYAVDVEVETDTADVSIEIACLGEIIRELSICHQALAAVGASVVSWGWGWGWTAVT